MPAGCVVVAAWGEGLQVHACLLFGCMRHRPVRMAWRGVVSGACGRSGGDYYAACWDTKFAPRVPGGKIVSTTHRVAPRVDGSQQ